MDPGSKFLVAGAGLPTRPVTSPPPPPLVVEVEQASQTRFLGQPHTKVS